MNYRHIEARSHRDRSETVCGTASYIRTLLSKSHYDLCHILAMSGSELNRLIRFQGQIWQNVKDMSHCKLGNISKLIFKLAASVHPSFGRSVRASVPSVRQSEDPPVHPRSRPPVRPTTHSIVYPRSARMDPGGWGGCIPHQPKKLVILVQHWCKKLARSSTCGNFFAFIPPTRNSCIRHWRSVHLVFALSMSVFELTRGLWGFNSPSSYVPTIVTLPTPRS